MRRRLPGAVAVERGLRPRRPGRRVRPAGLPAEGGGRGRAVAPLPALDVPHEVDDDLALLGVIPGGKMLHNFVEYLLKKNASTQNPPEDLDEEDLEVLGKLELPARGEGGLRGDLLGHRFRVLLGRREVHRLILFKIMKSLTKSNFSSSGLVTNKK